MTRGRTVPPARAGVAGRRRAAATGAAVALAAGLLAAPTRVVAGPQAGTAGGTVAIERPTTERAGFRLAQMRRLTPVQPADEAPVGETREPVIVRPAPMPMQQEQRRAVPLERIPAGPLDDQARMAGFEVRLGQLEEELRRLTGRIEQTEFEQRRLNERFDRLVADLDARLSAIEARLPGGGAAAAVEGDAAPPPAGAEGGAGAAGEEGPLAGLPAGPEPAPPAADATPATTDELPDTGDPIAAYHGAMDLLRAGDYAAAETALDGLLAAHPDHQLAANAAYWLAETRYVRGDYADAAATFARNYRTYGADAPKAPDNLLKLGMSLGALGDTEKACQVFAELDTAFPDAPAHIGQAAARERTRVGCS